MERVGGISTSNEGLSAINRTDVPCLQFTVKGFLVSNHAHRQGNCFYKERRGFPKLLKLYRAFWSYYRPAVRVAQAKSSQLVLCRRITWLPDLIF